MQYYNSYKDDPTYQKMLREKQKKQENVISNAKKSITPSTVNSASSALGLNPNFNRIHIDKLNAEDAKKNSFMSQQEVMHNIAKNPNLTKQQKIDQIDNISNNINNFADENIDYYANRAAKISDIHKPFVPTMKKVSEPNEWAKNNIPAPVLNVMKNWANTSVDVTNLVPDLINGFWSAPAQAAYSDYQKAVFDAELAKRNNMLADENRIGSDRNFKSANQPYLQSKANTIARNPNLTPAQKESEIRKIYSGMEAQNRLENRQYYDDELTKHNIYWNSRPIQYLTHKTVDPLYNPDAVGNYKKQLADYEGDIPTDQFWLGQLERGGMGGSTAAQYIPGMKVGKLTLGKNIANLAKPAVNGASIAGNMTYQQYLNGQAELSDVGIEAAKWAALGAFMSAVHPALKAITSKQTPAATAATAKTVAKANVVSDSAMQSVRQEVVKRASQGQKLSKEMIEKLISDAEKNSASKLRGALDYTWDTAKTTFVDTETLANADHFLSSAIDYWNNHEDGESITKDYLFNGGRWLENQKAFLPFMGFGGLKPVTKYGLAPAAEIGLSKAGEMFPNATSTFANALNIPLRGKAGQYQKAQQKLGDLNSSPSQYRTISQQQIIDALSNLPKEQSDAILNEIYGEARSERVIKDYKTEKEIKDIVYDLPEGSEERKAAEEILEADVPVDDKAKAINVIAEQSKETQNIDPNEMIGEKEIPFGDNAEPIQQPPVAEKPKKKPGRPKKQKQQPVTKQKTEYIPNEEVDLFGNMEPVVRYGEPRYGTRYRLEENTKQKYAPNESANLYDKTTLTSSQPALANENTSSGINTPKKKTTHVKQASKDVTEKITVLPAEEKVAEGGEYYGKSNLPTDYKGREEIVDLNETLENKKKILQPEIDKLKKEAEAITNKIDSLEGLKGRIEQQLNSFAKKGQKGNYKKVKGGKYKEVNEEIEKAQAELKAKNSEITQKTNELKEITAPAEAKIKEAVAKSDNSIYSMEESPNQEAYNELKRLRKEIDKYEEGSAQYNIIFNRMEQIIDQIKNPDKYTSKNVDLNKTNDVALLKEELHDLEGKLNKATKQKTINDLNNKINKIKNRIELIEGTTEESRDIADEYNELGDTKERNAEDINFDSYEVDNEDLGKVRSGKELKTLPSKYTKYIDAEVGKVIEDTASALGKDTNNFNTGAASEVLFKHFNEKQYTKEQLENIREILNNESARRRTKQLESGEYIDDVNPQRDEAIKLLQKKVETEYKGIKNQPKQLSNPEFSGAKDRLQKVGSSIVKSFEESKNKDSNEAFGAKKLTGKLWSNQKTKITKEVRELKNDLYNNTAEFFRKQFEATESKQGLYDNIIENLVGKKLENLYPGNTFKEIGDTIDILNDIAPKDIKKTKLKTLVRQKGESVMRELGAANDAGDIYAGFEIIKDNEKLLDLNEGLDHEWTYFDDYELGRHHIMAMDGAIESIYNLYDSKTRKEELLKIYNKKLEYAEKNKLGSAPAIKTMMEKIEDGRCNPAELKRMAIAEVRKLDKAYDRVFKRNMAEWDSSNSKSRDFDNETTVNGVTQKKYKYHQYDLHLPEDYDIFAKYDEFRRVVDSMSDLEHSFEHRAKGKVNKERQSGLSKLSQLVNSTKSNLQKLINIKRSGDNHGYNFVKSFIKGTNHDKMFDLIKDEAAKYGITERQFEEYGAAKGYMNLKDIARAKGDSVAVKRMKDVIESVGKRIKGETTVDENANPFAQKTKTDWVSKEYYDKFIEYFKNYDEVSKIDEEIASAKEKAKTLKEGEKNAEKFTNDIAIAEMKDKDIIGRDWQFYHDTNNGSLNKELVYNDMRKLPSIIESLEKQISDIEKNTKNKPSGLNLSKLKSDYEKAVATLFRVSRKYDLNNIQKTYSFGSKITQRKKSANEALIKQAQNRVKTLGKQLTDSGDPSAKLNELKDKLTKAKEQLNYLNNVYNEQIKSYTNYGHINGDYVVARSIKGNNGLEYLNDENKARKKSHPQVEIHFTPELPGTEKGRAVFDFDGNHKIVISDAMVKEAEERLAKEQGIDPVTISSLPKEIRDQLRFDAENDAIAEEFGHIEGLFDDALAGKPDASAKLREGLSAYKERKEHYDKNQNRLDTLRNFLNNNSSEVNKIVLTSNDKNLLRVQNQLTRKQNLTSAEQEVHGDRTTRNTGTDGLEQGKLRVGKSSNGSNNEGKELHGSTSVSARDNNLDGNGGQNGNISAREELRQYSGLALNSVSTIGKKIKEDINKLSEHHKEYGVTTKQIETIREIAKEAENKYKEVKLLTPERAEAAKDNINSDIFVGQTHHYTPAELENAKKTGEYYENTKNDLIFGSNKRGRNKNLTAADAFTNIYDHAFKAECMKQLSDITNKLKVGLPSDGKIPDGYEAVNERVLNTFVHGRLSRSAYNLFNSEGAKDLFDKNERSEQYSYFNNLHKEEAGKKDFLLPKKYVDMLLSFHVETSSEAFKRYKGAAAKLRATSMLIGEAVDATLDVFKKIKLSNPSFVVHNRPSNFTLMAQDADNIGQLAKNSIKAFAMKKEMLPQRLLDDAITSEATYSKKKYSGYKQLDDFYNMLSGEYIEKETLDRLIKDDYGNIVRDENGNAKYKDLNLAQKGMNAYSATMKPFKKLAEGVRDVNDYFEVWDRKTQFLTETERITKKFNKKFGKELKKMGQQLATTEQMMDAIRDYPELETLVVNNIENVLGNYRSYTPFEQRVARRVFPFYSWIRTVARSTYQLAKNNPQRVALMLKEMSMIRKRNDDLKDFQAYSLEIPVKDPKTGENLRINHGEYWFPLEGIYDIARNRELDEKDVRTSMNFLINATINAIEGKNSFGQGTIQSRKYSPITRWKDKKVKYHNGVRVDDVKSEPYTAGYVDVDTGKVYKKLPVHERAKYFLSQVAQGINPYVGNANSFMKVGSTIHGLHNLATKGEYREPDLMSDVNPFDGYNRGERTGIYDNPDGRYKKYSMSGQTQLLNRLGLGLQPSYYKNKEERRLDELAEKQKRYKNKKKKNK